MKQEIEKYLESQTKKTNQEIQMFEFEKNGYMLVYHNVSGFDYCCNSNNSHLTYSKLAYYSHLQIGYKGNEKK